MSGLTRPQWALLEYLRAHFASATHSPSYEDISAAMGWRSKSHVREHLSALAAAGYIRWQPRKQRSIELADGPLTLAFPTPEIGREVALVARAKGLTVQDFVLGCVLPHLNVVSFRGNSVSRETPARQVG